MKFNLKNFTSILFSSLMSIAVLGSCIEPNKPENEVENKLHENPFFATYTLIEGKMSDIAKFDNNPSLQDVERLDNVQVIEWATSKEKGWHITENSPSKGFKVKSKEKSPNTVYILKIEYKNSKGESMNHQFIDNHQDNIHQHFFKTIKGGLIEDENELPYIYRYVDTAPLNDDNGKHIGDKNPLGFKGLMRFKARKSFKISIDLLHCFVSKYDDNGNTSPFYAPRKELRGNSDSDISVKIRFEQEE